MSDPGPHAVLLDVAGSRRGERGVLGTSLLLAITVHLAVLLLVVLPDPPPPPEPPPQPVGPTVTRTKLPPPPIEPPRAAATPIHERKVPVPELEPERIEPAKETPSRVDEWKPSAGEVDLLVPPVAPPKDPGPFPVTIIGLVRPELILATKIDPDYPELGRVGHVGAQVLLQAVIAEDGSVREVEVLQCSRPGYGFEAAAVEAVRQWRYRPATMGGRAVAVYLTVAVDFTVR